MSAAFPQSPLRWILRCLFTLCLSSPIARAIPPVRWDSPNVPGVAGYQYVSMGQCWTAILWFKAILELFQTSFVGRDLFLFMFLLSMTSSSKGFSPKRHPYTRVSFLHQSLQTDIGKRMLSSPPASLLPRYGRNRIRAGRRTKTQLKRVI